MSRLVVKNLPKNVTKELVQETFSKKGIVTDVQLKYTQDGKFRHFGFVGFNSAKDASAAMKYFDNTFINAARIRVELCAELGDTKKPKAWCDFNKEVREKKKLKALQVQTPEETKKAEEAERLQKIKSDMKKQIEVGKPKVNEIIAKALKKYADDEHFKEFMEVHAGGNKTIWDNDLVTKELQGTKKEKKKGEMESTHHESEESTDEKPRGDQEEVELPEEKNKLAEETISDLEYLKKMTVKDCGVTGDKSSKTVINLKDKSKKASHKLGKEINNVGTNKTEKTEEDASSVEGEARDSEADDQKPPRSKMPKQKKEFKELFTVKVSNLSFKDKKKDLKQFFHPLKLASVRIPPKIAGIAYLGFKTERGMRQALSKDHSFFGGKRISVAPYTKKAEVEEVSNDPKWLAQKQSLDGEETVSVSGRIFVRNLSYATTEEDLEVLFHKYGDTTEISMPLDRNTKMSKGFAHVTYMFPEHAAKAFRALDGTVFNGRMLHLLPGKAKPSLEEAMMEDGISYSAKKNLKLKSQSGSSHNWNTLFLGNNAVADVMASTYNTTKEHVLDGKGTESLAVRLALGETQIVTETKDFLMKHGVRLDAFNQTAKLRSKRVVLLKNLPANTTEKEILELFGPHGELQRVVLPPSGVTAIIEFVEPSEARKAFTRLAYTKFKNLPLYLEWAPLDTFQAAPNENEDKGSVTVNDENASVPDATEAAISHSAQPEAKAEEPEDQNEPPEPDTTLYVKNINFKTTEHTLMEHFKKCGTIHSLSIAYRRSNKSPSESLSKGYGFVRFKKNASALLALKTLQKVSLDGHRLELTPSHRTVSTDVQTARKKTVVGKQTGSKILVRNIPFQANYQEIKDLFKTFGELKAVRLPKKMTGTERHRGFVFIEYESKSDAKRAFEALCQSTHLYGRRLVLEWAAEDDDIDDLRKRTADHFFTASSNAKAMRVGLMTMDKEKMDTYE